VGTPERLFERLHATRILVEQKPEVGRRFVGRADRQEHRIFAEGDDSQDIDWFSSSGLTLRCGSSRLHQDPDGSHIWLRKEPANKEES
jgi:hypothetical protein